MGNKSPWYVIPGIVVCVVVFCTVVGAMSGVFFQLFFCVNTQYILYKPWRAFVVAWSGIGCCVFGWRLICRGFLQSFLVHVCGICLCWCTVQDTIGLYSKLMPVRCGVGTQYFWRRPRPHVGTPIVWYKLKPLLCGDSSNGVPSGGRPVSRVEHSYH